MIKYRIFWLEPLRDGSFEKKQQDYRKKRLAFPMAEAKSRRLKAKVTVAKIDEAENRIYGMKDYDAGVSGEVHGDIS